jgi:hypothetical protein
MGYILARESILWLPENYPFHWYVYRGYWWNNNSLSASFVGYFIYFSLGSVGYFMTWYKALSAGRPSSHIKEFAHEGGRMYVRFQNGAVHSYPAPDTFLSAMRAAPSAGVFFNAFLKRRKSKRHEEMEVKK